MAIKAKFFVIEIKHLHIHTPDEVMAEIELQAVTQTNEGNTSWSKYTPSGNIRMTVTNPNAIAAFEIGQSYSLTFEKSED